ncbi:MAG: VIT family protein [Patescibacteria group bacterium]
MEKQEEHIHKKELILQYIQPGLLGLMDGSVSTLAPMFAAAFATHSNRITLLIGLSAAIGAAISMGFAEALSDTGVHTGRGHPIRRGTVTALMTFAGGIVHSLPFLLPDFNLALYLAYLTVGLELMAISYIRYHYFRVNFFISSIQVIVGGVLVVLAGVFIGSA